MLRGECHTFFDVCSAQNLPDWPDRSGFFPICCFARNLATYATAYARQSPATQAAVRAQGGLAFAENVLELHRKCPKACGAALQLLVEVLERYWRDDGTLPHEEAPSQQLVVHVVSVLTANAKDYWNDYSDDDPELCRMQLLAWSARALLSLAGGAGDAAPHAMARRGPIFPEVYITACAGNAYKACVQAAIECAIRKGADTDDEDTSALFRDVGRIFRGCMLAANDPDDGPYAELAVALAHMRLMPNLEALQWWGLTYAALPLAHAQVLAAADAGSAVSAVGRSGVWGCRARCCAPRRSFGNAREAFVFLDSLGEAIPGIVAAAERFGDCRNPAVRLLAYLAQGDASAQRRMAELGVPAALLRMRAATIDRLRASDRPARGRARRQALPAEWDGSDSDADAAGGEDAPADGQCLSDCGEDYHGNTVADDSEEAEERVSELRTVRLINRAYCAVTGARNAAAAITAALSAASDAAAAALLAEEDAKPGAGAASPVAKAKKSKKSKSKAKSGAAASAQSAPEPPPAADDAAADAEDVDEDAMVRALARTALTSAAPPARTSAPQPAVAVQPPPPQPAAVLPPPQAQTKRSQKPRAAPAAKRCAAGACNCGSCAAPVFQLPQPPSAAASALAVDLFPWLAMADTPAPAALQPADAAHEDDALCVICLDAERDTPLPGCAAAHAAVLCGGCAARVLLAAAPTCPLCRAPS